MAKFQIPDGWTRGELLRYQSNTQTCIVFRASQPDSRDSIQFEGSQNANDFMGWWYAPLAVRMAEQPEPEPVNDVIRLDSEQMIDQFQPSPHQEAEGIQSAVPERSRNLLSDESHTLTLAKKRGRPRKIVEQA
jgi:hypothetical protein